VAAWGARDIAFASGLGFLIAGISFALLHAIFLVGPLAQIDHFAAFAAERAKAVVGVPLVFFATARTGNDQMWFEWYHDEILQKVNSNGTSCSNSVDLAA